MHTRSIHMVLRVNIGYIAYLSLTSPSHSTQEGAEGHNSSQRATSTGDRQQQEATAQVKKLQQHRQGDNLHADTGGQS